MRAQVGQVIHNKYRLLRLIGDGGMGSVYEARHEVLGTSVALKFLHPELARRDGLVQRFLQEARVSAQIQSPHVVRVTDVDQLSSGAFIVMEYLEGRTLQVLYEDLYRAGQQLAYEDALEYAMQILEGVEAAHKTGVVHRDLKPDNVMITFDAKGRPLLKVLDFGIAKLKVSGAYDRGLTRPGVIMGTPEYMAPEQAFSADAVDARADIFSLGVILFEMLAGRRPVGGEDPQLIAASYISGRIARITDLAPHVPPELGAAVHRAMAPQADGRWPTVTEMRDAIEPFALAARAPSASSISIPALDVSSLSRPPATPAPAPVTPPATNVGDAVRASMSGPPAPVSKTLPPGSMASEPLAASREPPTSRDPEPPVLDPGATNPAEPPAMSAPPASPEAASPEATPLGGFEQGSAAEAAPAGDVPATKSASPYVPDPPRASFDPAATDFAVPLAMSANGAVLPAPARVSRASGTAIGDVAPVLAVGVADLALGPAAFAPPLSALPPLPAAPRQRPSSVLSSLPVILLLAAGVAGAVVGGVYLAQNRAKSDDHEDPPVAVAPSTTVVSDPPAVDPAPTTATGPSQTPASKLPPHKPPPPPPRGSAGPVAPPAPSTNPSTRPIVIPIPPIVLPSSFPFAFPGFGPFEPPPSRPGEPPRGQPRSPREPSDPEPPRRQRPGSMPHGQQRNSPDGPLVGP